MSETRALATGPLSIAELIKRAGIVAASHPVLPSSAAMNIGTLAYDVPSEQSAAGQRILSVAETARKSGLEVANNAADDRARMLAEAAYVPLTFAAYRRAVGKIDSIKRALHSGGDYLPDDSPPLRRFAKQIYEGDTHTPDFRGYLAYLSDVNPALKSAVDREIGSASPQLLEELRKMHSIVIGGSGAGKSELLKLLVHHYVRHPELGAVLVLDPHGKLGREIAQWREFSGAGASRLVYLDANARPGVVPALNPFTVGSASPEEVSTIAAQLGDAVALLAEDGETISGNMMRLAKFAIRVLLERPGSSLMDLKRLLMAEEGDPLLKPALRHPDELVKDFFTGSFQSKNLDAAKEALVRRIEGALLEPAFRRIMTAPRPVDLQGALEAGKVVVVNVASAGSGDVALGRLLIAQAAALGLRRVYNPSMTMTPVHVFVDEATKLIAPPVFKILKELRKVGVHLTMAQQVLGDGMDAHQMRHIVQQTEIKLVGKNRAMGQAFKALGWDASDGLPWLNIGQFIAEWGNDGQHIHVQASSHLVGDANAMTPEEWQAVLERQLEAYHRPVTPTQAPTPDLSPESRWRRE